MRFRLLSLLFVLAGLLLLTPAGAALQDDADAEEKEEGLPLAASDTLSFTVTEGTWMSLDLSPDGQTIVFELLGDLYTLPVTGGAATRIMGGISFESQPVFSPDGSEIAFVSDRNGVENLWIANADGSEPRAVTKDGPTRDRPQLMVSPSWTADGQYLLVSKSRPPERTAAVFLIHRDGGTGVRLGDKPPEPTPGVPGSQPPNRLGAVASADGRHVYVSERRGTFNYNAQFPIWQVVRFDRETGEETTITSAPGSAMRPLLHPDGRHLVYATRHRTRTALRVRDLETGEERWLANGVTRDDQESRASRDTMPGYAFTSDGSALIATVDGGFRRIDFETGAMTAIPFEAQVEAEVAPRLYFPRRVDDGPAVTARIIRWPRVAPDGSAVVFSAFSRLYRMDLPGGTPARLTDSDEDEFMPAWSPDGNAIAYVTWSSTGGHLKTVAATGGAGTALTTDPAFYAEPAWHPAGDAIVIRRAPVKEHLYSFLREGSGKTDLYADEDEIGGMRPAELSELLLVPATGGDLTVIGPAEGGRFPHFTNDPDRVYLTGSSAGLYSLQLDGSDRRTHLKVNGRGAGANPPPASQIMLSPTGDRAFFELQNRHYLVEVPSFGKNTLEIKVGGGETPVPVREVAPEGGDHLAWSASGDAVVWSLGNRIYRQAAAAIGGEDDLAPDTFDAVVTEPRARPSGQILLKDAAQVLTMNGEEIIRGGDVLVEDNRIAAVGADLDAPEGARVFDVSGKTVMPGYVDAHAHMWAPRGVHQRQVFQHLANLAYGVTTTRDPQTSTADVFAYRDLQEIGRILAPRIYATGPGIFSRSGVYDADAADDFLKRYAEAYDAVTIKQYIVGDRIVRQWGRDGVHEAQAHPDHRGRPRSQAQPDPDGGRVLRPRAQPADRPHLRRRGAVRGADRHLLHADDPGRLRRALERELLLPEHRRGGRREAGPLHPGRHPRQHGAPARPVVPPRGIRPRRDLRGLHEGDARRRALRAGKPRPAPGPRRPLGDLGHAVGRAHRARDPDRRDLLRGGGDRIPRGPRDARGREAGGYPDPRRRPARRHPEHELGAPRHGERRTLRREHHGPVVARGASGPRPLLGRRQPAGKRRDPVAANHAHRVEMGAAWIRSPRA